MVRQLFSEAGLSRQLRKWLGVAVLCTAALWAQATTDPVNVSVFQGSKGQLHADSVRETVDVIYYSSLISNIDNPAKDVYRNTIAFLVNEDSRKVIPADFSATVTIAITITDKNGVEHDTIQRSLHIDYKTAAGTAYDARNYFYFDNARKVKVQIVSIDTFSATWNVTSVLQLENRMEVKRDYKFNCATTISSVHDSLPPASASNNVDELVVHWADQPFMGITHYDVEWTWIDSAAIDRYKDADAQLTTELLFKKNSSRVTIQDTVYNIPLIYDGTGYLFYRVRPVQYREDGKIIEGHWSAEVTSNITSYTYTNGHEPDLNWQVSTTYAEEGKRKTVIQYFDGTLRSRQTVTKDNVNNNTVVAETLYDYQGRPSINILPSPTLNTVIEYAKNFNRFLPGTTYPKDVYDLVPVGQTICMVGTPGLDSTSGAAQYYSANNSRVNDGVNRYIPEAFGYPYTETRYTQDATGRIASQGGVGADYQLGTGHETKYYYGSADQHEIDALFGTEVGDNSHYFKNMVRDGNGQYSVSYSDMHGRTIATALAGAAPANLKRLDSYNEQYITKNLLANGNNRVKERSIEAATTLLVPMTGPHDFHYALNPQSAEIAACNPAGQPVCYDCYYDLQIRVTGTCGQPPVIITRKNFTFGTYDVSCETGPPSLNVDTTIILEEGEYNITKTLTLSQDAQNWYRENVFLTKNICKSILQLYDSTYQVLMANANCNMTCTTCFAELGSETHFRNQFLFQQGFDTLNLAITVPYEDEIHASYNEALTKCQALCGVTENRLTAMRQMMLDDMVPGQGQYAKLDEDLNDDGDMNDIIYQPDDVRHQQGERETNTTFPYNIFNASNAYSPYPLQAPAFRHPVDETDNALYYKDKFGHPDVSLVHNPPAVDFSPQDFSTQFDPAWVTSLIMYHPEYPKLKYAQDHLAASYQWDAELQNIDTWSDAGAAGYLTSILDHDPFFNDLGSSEYYSGGRTYRQEMQDYIGTQFKNGKTIWQLAWIAINCANSNDQHCGDGLAATPPYDLNSCTGDWNAVWRIFRTIYLSEKDRMINKLLKDKFPAINYVRLQQLGYERRFGDYNELGGDYFATLPVHATNAQQAQAQADQYSETQLQQFFGSTCDSYIAGWRARLETCDQLASHTQKEEILNAITAGMRDVCIGGSDINHIYGSSTRKPGDLKHPQSFEEVITTVFAHYHINASELCHPYLIDYPQPYDKQRPTTDAVVIEQKDECVCSRINELKAEKLKVGYTGTLSQFIAYQHGVTISQGLLDTLTEGCSSGCTTYDPVISIPAILDCHTPLKSCLECKEYDVLKSEFKQKFPGFEVIYAAADADSVAINRNIAFEHFMNYRTGLNKSWPEYLQFETACQGYNTTWSCSRLDSIVTAYYQSHSNTVSGSECQQSFTLYFNQAFGTDSSFIQIQGLFMQFCGHMPDICQPSLTCRSLRQVINNFYAANGAINTATNCQSAFVNYFNTNYSTNYTWDELNDLSLQLCGKKLDVCSGLSCNRLQQILDNWHSCHFVMDSTCSIQWVVYFNGLAGTGLGYLQIDSLYKRCGISMDPCTPVAPCATLSRLLTSYYNMGNKACQGSGLDSLAPGFCNDCFKWYINNKLSINYSFEQVSLMYRSVCGTDLPVCEKRWDCSLLTSFANGFTTWYGTHFGEGSCGGLFTTRFNDNFGVFYTYEQVMAVYQLYCGQKPGLCSGQPVFSCTQLEQVYDGFITLYPHPSGYFGAGCNDAFTKYFNQAFGLSLDATAIAGYYTSLCSRSLNICGVDSCTRLQTFLSGYNARFGSYGLPQQLCRDLFTELFNQEYNTLQKYVWPDIVRIYQGCGVTLDMCAADGRQLLDCSKVEGARQAYYAFYNSALPDNNEVFTRFFNTYFNTPFTSYSQLDMWVTQNCGSQLNICGPEAPQAAIRLRSASLLTQPALPPRLCGGADPVFPTLVENGNPCDFLQQVALNAATEQYNVYLQHQKDNFDLAYKSKCLDAASLEVFTVRGLVAEYHYTLYYYDQAGNLVKTVPPAGVHADFSDGFYSDVQAARVSGGEKVPAHTLPTQYRYNTLNQVVAQKSPDGGESHFWYDRLGRLVVSQNAKQLADNKYSYSKYDILGRITEVGQLSGDAVTQAITQDAVQLNDWLTAAAASREQITLTQYDVPAHLSGSGGILWQANLRNRVSYSMVIDHATDVDYTSATYYSYDIHGNVDTLLQHYNTGVMHDVTGNAFKKVIYKYDLVSGKVNEVMYQPGVTDQFYHRYEYDAENKLTAVYTSHDDVYWEKQAHYDYYRHGPLARTELGQLGVQGTDYVYTLQGWLKGVNSTVTGDGFDVGGDGSPKTRVAADAYGFALHYNGNDYHPIYKFASPFAAINTTVLPGFKNLFNGNIAAMGVNIDKLARPLLYRYSYDQLNRLDSMQAYDGLNVASNIWAPVATADYRENISYDGNGNILSYLRNGTTAGGNPLAMDNMAYHYKTATNQLDHVNDDVTSTNYNSDIDDQSSANYGYDAIGNLVKDDAEGITSIEWTVYGKIAGITKVKAGLTTNISYTYDAAGNRIGKTVNGKKTWYVRDASGNVMAIYENGNSEINSGHLSQVEVDLYGSSRLGLWKPNRDVQATGWDVLQLTPAPGTSNGIATGKWIRGETFFELSNHLGNVLATILDRKIGVDGGSGNIDHYTADVASASDYYPFGMQMPERKFSGGAYRYGFNGKENDNEVKGEGNQQDYGMRIYDPRLGRFLSTDPLHKKYPELTPYQFASNRPIDGIDLDGLEYLSFHRAMYRMQNVTRTESIKMGNGTIQKLTTSFSLVNTIYQNIPASLQDSKTLSYKYVSGGPITEMGRDYTPAELSASIFDKNKHFADGPVFYGAAEAGKSTKDINSLKGNATQETLVLAQNINGVGGVIGPNGLGGMILNWGNQGEWAALDKEKVMRKSFYKSTNMIDLYLTKNSTTGTNGFFDQLKGIEDRTNLINFLTDGYLPTEHTDKLTGSAYSVMRRNAYNKQLLTAWHGLQIMQKESITIGEDTKNAVNDLLKKYKADGGGNEYDNINQFMTAPQK